MLTSLLSYECTLLTSKIMTGAMASKKGANRVVGTYGRIALTASVAYQRGMDHCVGLMAAPGVP